MIFDRLPTFHCAMSMLYIMVVFYVMFKNVCMNVNAKTDQRKKIVLHGLDVHHKEE